MKLTKTAVAVAIAGIAAAPMIASADTTLSGTVELNVNGTDADGDAGDPRVGNGDVLFGIVSEHELDNGLTGYGSLRVDLDRLSNGGDKAANSDANGDALKTAGSADAVYAGIKGGFGDIRIGEIPLAVEYGQVANDIFDVGDEINGGLSYTGSFGPVGLVANYSPALNQDAMGLGAKFSIGGFAIGLGAEDRDEKMNASAGVSFAFAGASIAAHYWTKEDGAGADDDSESVSAKVGYSFGGVTAGLTYSLLESDKSTVDKEAIRLDLGYGMGGGLTLSTRVTAETDNKASANDLTSWRVQVSKAF